MTPATYCRNCSLFLGEHPGKYCPNCAQETALHPPTIGEFVHEFVGHYVALEGRLWKTLLLLFFKPAELSREYLKGRRRRYVLPLRLYLTASLLFFLLVKFAGLGSGWNSPFNPQQASPQLREEMAAAMGCDKDKGNDGGKVHAALPQCDALRRVIEQRQNPQSGKGMSRVGIDPGEPAEEVIVCDQSSVPCSKVKKYLSEKYQGLTTRQMWENIRQKTYSSFPYAMFCLLPVFALVTRLVYWRRKLFYGEHMVYAFHIHSFAFFMMLAISFAPAGVDELLITLMFVHFFISLQRFFGGKWWATVLRYLAIGLTYPLIIAIVAFTALLGAVFL